MMKMVFKEAKVGGTELKIRPLLGIFSVSGGYKVTAKAKNAMISPFNPMF